MKLRNRKTGEIGYTAVLRSKAIVVMDENAIQLGSYTSLAELNEEWCDYEEPEEYWHIAELCAGLQKKQDTDNGEDRFNKQIGNYFETEEEAELAVRKLKAWKRVKRDLVSLNWQRERDGSFSVWGEFKTGNTLRADVYLDIHSKDLDLLFSGEDD